MKFAIFTIIKNEHEYLNEWIQYHLNLGIDHIFVYEDVNSSPHSFICKKYSNRVSCKSVLDIYDPAIRDKIIIDKIKNKKSLQVIFMKSILNFLCRNHTDYDWVFYIDADEFLTFENDTYNFENIFNQFNDYQIVSLQWQNYNANGHIYKPHTNVLESYHTTCDLLSRIIKCGATCKLAFNMRLYDSKNMKFNHHQADIAKWCKTDFSNDKEKLVYDKIYIRHYITKSFEEWCNKIFVRGQTYPSKQLKHFYELNKDIDPNSEDIKSILNKYGI